MTDRTVSIVGRKRKVDRDTLSDIPCHRSLSPSSPAVAVDDVSSNASLSSDEYLALYFKSRCDDENGWNVLQELSKTDPVAKAYVCDVLIHNDSVQYIRKDIARAEQLSRDVHYWIAATMNRPADVTRLYISGIFLAQGIGIPRNQEKAAAYIEEAASLGHCLAQYYVGVWHRDGRRVAKNMEIAAQYFRKAATQGHPMAQNMMGLCYATGQGVDMNVDDAEYWYQLAAAQGLQIAQTNMETVIERKATKNAVQAIRRS